MSALTIFIEQFTEGFGQKSKEKKKVDKEGAKLFILKHNVAIKMPSESAKTKQNLLERH